MVDLPIMAAHLDVEDTHAVQEEVPVIIIIVHILILPVRSASRRITRRPSVGTYLMRIMCLIRGLQELLHHMELTPIGT
jgi:hypothetical protein